MNAFVYIEFRLIIKITSSFFNVSHTHVHTRTHRERRERERERDRVRQTYRQYVYHDIYYKYTDVYVIIKSTHVLYNIMIKNIQNKRLWKTLTQGFDLPDFLFNQYFIF